MFTARGKCPYVAQGAIGIPEPDRLTHDYPHEFSGGQRQRICIARVLAVKPRLIICDEPTSALDVSVQAQILALFRTLQHTYQLGYLFITHNISVVEYIARHVAVMYQGEIVEQGPAEQVLKNPQNDYTKKLLSAVPRVEKRYSGYSRQRAIIRTYIDQEVKIDGHQ